MHRYWAPFPYQGQIVLAKLTVKEFARESEGKRIYSVEAVDVVKPAGISTASISENRRNYVAQAGFEEKLQRKIDEIKGKASLGSSPDSESADSQPDLFTAANAPDAREKLGDVKAGTMNALGAYKALTAKREKLGSLSGEEENQLLQAEKALGQKLAFDMESVKGKADSQPVIPRGV